jgi:DNA-binding MurR/RpiR family transcriptional regulator
VSTPTVIRLARKLGFDGFPDLQKALREEVSASIRKPMAKHDGWVARASTQHILNEFAQSLSQNLQDTLERLDSKDFDKVAALLADPARPLFLAGGRITRSNADYFFNHLQIIRPGVTLLSQSPNVWPQYLLDMDSTAVLILFDIRRYEKHILKLGELARAKGAAIVLFTDQWGSPAASIATHTFRAHIEAPSAWDSTIVIMYLVEALIAEVQRRNQDRSRSRIEELEAMFSVTRLFRNPGRGGDG